MPRRPLPRTPAKHPGRERDVARDGRGQRREHQDRHLEQPRSVRVEVVQDAQRAVREREREHEDEEPGRVLAGQAVTAADPEREAPVRRGVADRGQQQAPPRWRRRSRARRREAGTAARRRASTRRRSRRSAPPAKPLRAARRRAGRQRRRDDVDARVGVVDPVDRHLVDAHPAALRRDQQLGVEEPRLVVHRVEQLGQHIGADGLEAALRVGEPRAQRDVQDAVVRARDSSRFGPRVTRDPRARREPIATSLWPESSGASSGSSACRSVDRSTSMYATTRARLADHAARSARPRPFCSSRRTRT